MNKDSYGVLRELLGPMRQIGYVVDDVEDRARDWLDRFGIGPWRVKHGIRLTNCVYRDVPVDVEVSIATAYSGPAEVKLMTQTDGPPSMYSDFLDEDGPGAQHVCFYPSNFATARQLFLETSAEVVLEGAIGSTDFVYLDDGKGQVVELADVPAAAIDMRAQRLEAAAAWDGTNPIQVVS